MAKKITKGKVYFYLKNGYIEGDVHEYTEEEKEWTGLYPTEFEIYDLMDGLEFADCVEGGGFIDNDGSIAEIFVNDFLSNLGIWDEGMHQGKFCLGLYDFRRLCKEYKVEVNWANK
jgi:hypothetical protein